MTEIHRRGAASDWKRDSCGVKSQFGGMNYFHFSVLAR